MDTGHVMGLLLLAGLGTKLKGKVDSIRYRIVTDHERSISRLKANDILNAAIVSTDPFAGGGSAKGPVSSDNDDWIRFRVSRARRS